jgi:hypothetical protein
MRVLVVEDERRCWPRTCGRSVWPRTCCRSLEPTSTHWHWRRRPVDLDDLVLDEARRLRETTGLRLTPPRCRPAES